MKIRVLDHNEIRLWDSFIAEFTNHNFFHLIDWHNVLIDTFHHRMILIAAEDNTKKLLGCFPLFLVKFPVLGSKLISTPYQAVVGGPISNDPEIIEGLLKFAIDLGHRINVKFIEIRGCDLCGHYEKTGFELNDVKASITSTNLSYTDFKTIRNNHQRGIKKALKNNVLVKEAVSLDEWKLFYELFEKQQRTYAAPGFGWKFFCLLYKRLPDKVNIRLVWHEGRCVGGILLFHHNNTVFYKQGVVSEQYKQMGAAKLMMWDSIMWAKEHEYETFNFGMSFNSMKSLISYKEGFNGKTIPVENYICPIKGFPPSINDMSEGYQISKKIWRRLPLSVTKSLGMVLSHWYC